MDTEQARERLIAERDRLTQVRDAASRLSTAANEASERMEERRLAAIEERLDAVLLSGQEVHLDPEAQIASSVFAKSLRTTTIGLVILVSMIAFEAMAVTPAGRELLREWSDASEALGLGPVTEAGPMTRGAGDISFVASYVPGLVGVGAMGKGSHAEGEAIFLDSVSSQAKRNAVLMERLAHQPSGH